MKFAVRKDGDFYHVISDLETKQTFHGTRRYSHKWETKYKTLSGATKAAERLTENYPTKTKKEFIGVVPCGSYMGEEI